MSGKCKTKKTIVKILIQTILDEQGVEISEGEQRELEESYLSFSGFSDETKKIQNIVIVGLILLLIFKK